MNEERDEEGSFRRGNDRQQRGGFDRPTVKGNWQCSECGTEITELPFEPSEGRPIYCRDCYRKNRPPRRDFRR